MINKNKYSIGLSFTRMSSDEWCRLLTNFSENISSVYFSPTESSHFQTRKTIYNFSISDDERKRDLDIVIKCAQDNHIPINIVLNSGFNREAELIHLYNAYRERYTKIDAITTILPIASSLIQRGDCTSELICSYNQGILNHNELESIAKSKVFKYVVLGNHFLRDSKALNILKRYDVSPILLLNNGCAYNCMKFCNQSKDYCEKLFLKNLEERKSINYIYARQSIFPEEIIEHPQYFSRIAHYKLSTRPISYSEIYNLLESYISHNSYKFISENIRNYHLYARLGHFIPHYPTLSYNIIQKYKNDIWNSQINQQLH